MPDFIHGLALAEAFYFEAAGPLLDANFPAPSERYTNKQARLLRRVANASKLLTRRSRSSTRVQAVIIFTAVIIFVINFS